MPIRLLARFRVILPHPSLRLFCGLNRVSGSGCSRVASLRCLRASQSAGIAFAMMVGAIVLVVFWMAGGHALVLTPTSDLQALTVAPPPTSVAIAEPVDVLVPDPVVTSSVPAEAGPAESGSIIHAKPRPARIERAGSILMIRPEGG
jgi:hypothetical protein